MERVFHEMGTGSMLSVHTHYTKQVLQYHERTLQACEELRDKYTRLTSPAVLHSAHSLKPLLK